jgi:hypothetical protein
MLDTLAFAPAPTAGGLSGKRTFGSAPARRTGASVPSDDALDVGDGRVVALDDAFVLAGALVGLDVGGDVAGGADVVALGTDVVARDVALDAEGLAPLPQAASVRAATTSTEGASLT